MGLAAFASVRVPTEVLVPEVCSVGACSALTINADVLPGASVVHARLLAHRDPRVPALVAASLNVLVTTGRGGDEEVSEKRMAVAGSKLTGRSGRTTVNNSR